MRFLMIVTAAIAGAVIVPFTVDRVSASAPDTHSRNAEPDYRRVFNQEVVNRLDIRMAPGDWETVLADMQSMAGRSGFGLNVGFSSEQLAACSGRLEANACTAGDPVVHGRCVQTGFPPGQLACVPVIGGENAGGDETEILPRTPVYVPVDVSFDGETFRRVGFRLKGNSTLFFTWRRGSDKLPFRLNFDGLESRFPETRDQTFFGFPNLAFTNGNLDNSYLRGKVVTDLFREAGIPAAQVAFMRVYLDRGAGLSYLGLYTMLEVPDGPMLRRVFGSDRGNLYKPHGIGGRWAAFDRESLPKRTNQEDEDWTDIQDAIAVLHSPKADRASWRSRFEARFDVPVFLRWLALNTIIGNVDAYGGVSGHNYYPYGSPRHRDRIFWIPWDHDLAMPTGGLGTPLPGTPIDLFHDRAGGNWPLIRFLLDDPMYRQMYRAQVDQLMATVFDPARVSATLRSEQARIFPHVVGPQGELFSRSFVGSPAQFDASVYGPNGLIDYVNNRAAAVQAALRVAR
jgi:spore coat protein CotH